MRDHGNSLTFVPKSLAQPGRARITDSGPPSNTRRVRLADETEFSGMLDGAWWPGSGRLTDELPLLLNTVAGRISNIVIVGYHREGWEPAPDTTDVDGRTIRLLGFRGHEPSVIVINEDGHHLALQVIPADTPEAAALQALNDNATRRLGSGGTAPMGSAALRAIADVAAKLAQREGHHDGERAAQILTWCQEASAQFENARIQSFVPILVEHIVSARIRREPSPPVDIKFTPTTPSEH